MCIRDRSKTGLFPGDIMADRKKQINFLAVTEDRTRARENIALMDTPSSLVIKLDSESLA